MSPPVISVENLGKKYRIHHQQERQRYVALRDVLADKARSAVRGPLSVVRRWWGKGRRKREDSRLNHAAMSPLPASNSPLPRSEDFWALKDVSFEVRQGEVMGIIGRNGAGKSTLLKILSRITEPTEGRVRIRGRVASLLEVGTGFHPELTGRENIFLNGAILGMTRAEIRRKFDEIVAFAEVEKFLDTPVKRYSSGMYVRLAFGVAAHLEPEILIVDEVLAVGDAQFQKKCLAKMGEVAHGGRTVLFVSHNMVAVRSLCSLGILLTAGRLKGIGPAADVVSAYVNSGEARVSERAWAEHERAPGNGLVRIVSIKVAPETADSADVIGMETPVVVEVVCQRLEADKVVHLTFHLINQDEVIVLTTSPGCCPAQPGRYLSRCVIPGNLLNSGGYRLKLLIVEDGSRVTLVEESLATFAIEDLREREGGWMGREPSAIQVPLAWHTEESAAREGRGIAQEAVAQGA